MKTGPHNSKEASEAAQGFATAAHGMAWTGLAWVLWQPIRVGAMILSCSCGQ